MARFDPKTETFTEFPLANAESDPRRIEVDSINPSAREIARPPDAVRVGRVNLDFSADPIGVCQRKLGESFGFRIEARHLSTCCSLNHTSGLFQIAWTE